MRSVSVVATVLSLLAGVPAWASAQTEVVGDFRGYLWGTPVEAIPEIAGTGQVGVKDGMPIWSATVELHGTQVLAGFYFHPESGGLIEGAYVIPLTLESCHPMWAEMVEEVERAYPALVLEEDVPVRAPEDRAVYDTDCEYFAFNSHRLEWRATWANPGSPYDRVFYWLRTIERVPRMIAVYRGGAGQAWADRPKPGAPLEGPGGR